MNDDNQTSEPQEPLAMTHERKITPLNPNVQPEVPLRARPALNEQPVFAQPQQKPVMPSSLPKETSTIVEESRSIGWAKSIRMLVTGLIGAVVAVTYSYYWTGSIVNLTQLASHNYSPILLLDTLIPMFVIMVIYGLILRYALRSQRSRNQALLALPLTLLSVIGLIGFKHLGNTTVSVLGEASVVSLVLAAIIGFSIFALTNYFAERLWSWRISRGQLAAITVCCVVAITFGSSSIISFRSKAKKAQEIKQSDINKADQSQGLYNFDGGYQQYYLNDESQVRFTVVGLTSASITPSEDSKNSPHSTQIELKDKNYSGTNTTLTVRMWQSKVLSSYNPPSNCGNPSPGQEYFDQQTGDGTYKGVCNKVQDISGIGTLYGRNQYQPEPKVADTYDWYYVKYGDTLVTLAGLSTLSNKDAVKLFTSLKVISPTELLVRSKTLSSTKN